MEIVGMLVSMAIFFFISQVLGDTVAPHLQPYGTDYFNFTLLGLAFYSFFNTNSLASAVQAYQSRGESLLTLWPDLLALSLFSVVLLPLGLLSFR